jgi:hypothetical protein
MTRTTADQEGRCIVAALAAEAATIAQADWALTQRSNREATPPFPIPYLGGLYGGVDGPSVETVRRSLMKRLDAIFAFAPHHEAKSRKGALFQLIAAAHLVLDAYDAIACNKLGDAGSTALLTLQGNTESLISSALNCFMDDADMDIKTLVQWVINPAQTKEVEGRAVLSELARIRQDELAKAS